MTRATGVPPELAGLGNRVVRPRDSAYSNPSLEFRRLERRGVLQKLATGYYLLPPDTHRARREWRPPIEAVALGVAVADYGPARAALMGVSAARHHGALPRELATAVVAVPKQRPLLRTARGRIRFVHTDVSRLDVVRGTTEVVQGLVTSVEQAVLDLADRPTLGDVTPATASEAILALAPRCDWALVAELAARQRKRAALARAAWLASPVTYVDPPVPKPRSPVDPLGLRPRSPTAPQPFGIRA